MKQLYYHLRSYAILIWDCFTVGPREAWRPFRAAQLIAKTLDEKGESK